MQIYMYIGGYLYVYVHVNAYAYVYVYVYVYVHVNAYAYVYVYVYVYVYECRCSPGQNKNFGGPLTKIIQVDIVLDNNAFIACFTGEPEDDYLDKVVCPALARRVRAQRFVQ